MDRQDRNRACGNSGASREARREPPGKICRRWPISAAAVPIAILATIAAVNGQRLSSFLPNGVSFPNSTGASQTYSSLGGGIDMTGPFFQSLGSNGRSCATCHQPSDGMSVSAASVQRRFFFTQGQDPIFRTNDGSVCDHDIKTATLEERREAYRLLLSRGLIRVALPVPAGAEFTVQSVSNRYGCNETSTLSMYRRPLPATNLNFLSTVMADGRESTPLTGTQTITYPDPKEALLADLAQQAIDATTGHAQGEKPTPDQVEDIVEFETSLHTAQALDYFAGSLHDDGAKGGPEALAVQRFFIGINDSFPPSFDLNPTGRAFNPNVFKLFKEWDDSLGRRASIARGEELFNSKPITISRVAGINDVPGLPASFPGTCGTCHDTPNVGNHSVSAPLNIGVADPNSPLDVDYLPVFTLKNIATGDVVKTTDPGRALITGKWADIGKTKGPILRGLASRAPYFHNGSAHTLADVIEFYDKRFNIGFTDQEKADLVAFLSAL